MSEIKQITTTLYGKQEVFRMLALAEATGLPLLLEGDPGVGKTRAVLDYAKTAYYDKPEDFMDGVFILETDEGTRSSEVKGTVDMQSLVRDNQYKINSPITRAKFILINEVDKASSPLRNSFLGIMNEKVHFNGQDKIPCVWNLFVATCNKIPEDEVGSPFWDRFILKTKVNRVSMGDLQKYFENGGKNYKTSLKIKYPSKEDLESITIPKEKMEKFLEVCYKECSDRTISFAPMLAKNVMFVYNTSMDKALIKVAELMAGDKAARELDRMISSKEKKAVLDRIDLLGLMTDSNQLQSELQNIENMVNKFVTSGDLDSADVTEIQDVINLILSNHPAYADSEAYTKLAGAEEAEF